jgi:hypothetical protein
VAEEGHEEEEAAATEGQQEEGRGGIALLEQIE